MDKTFPDEVAGLRVHSAGSGPPVLLLHGFGASSATWSRVAPGLLAKHTVISVDLRGFGHSAKPLDDSYGLADHAEIVLRVIDALDLRNLAIVGNSLGGGVALLVALRLVEAGSDRLRNLVLIDSIGCPQRMPLFVLALRCRGLGPLLLRLVPPRWAVRVVMWQAYRRPSRIDPALVEAYADPLYSKGGRHALIATARGLIPPDIDHLLEGCRRITAPAMLIWGRQDRIVPLWVGERLRDLLPKGRLIVLDDCGHVPQEEQPAATAKLLADFL